MEVDVWSIGCIFAEMHKREPFLMGDSEIDQVHKIFRAIGTPEEKTWPGVSKLKEWRNNFPSWKPKNMEDLVPHMEPEGVNLLREMLHLDPAKRITCRNALKHP